MNGAVSKYKNRHGEARYKARCDVPVPPGMPRRQASKSGFTSRADALAWLREMDQAQDGGATPSAMSLAEWLDQWSPDVTPATANEYRKVVARWLVPQLGNVRLRDLGTEHVEALLAAMSDRSPKTRRNVHGVLRSALRDGQRRGLVAFNAASRVSAPSGRTAEMRVWDAAQLASFLAVAARDELAPLWRLMATTGIRRGEVCGLERSDLRGSTLHIRRALVEVRGQVLVKEPKTHAGQRILALDDQTRAVLVAWRVTSGAQPRMWDVNPNALTKRFARLVERSPAPRIRLHDLRHTYATLALSQCRTMADVKTLSRRLGHASVTITLDTYSHAMQAQDSHLATAVAGLLSVEG